MAFDLKGPLPTLQDAALALLTKEHDRRLMEELKIAFASKEIDFNEEEFKKVEGVKKDKWTHYFYKGIFLMRVSDFEIKFKPNQNEIFTDNKITIEAFSVISFNEQGI